MKSQAINVKYIAFFTQKRYNESKVKGKKSNNKRNIKQEQRIYYKARVRKIEKVIKGI